ncbi:VanZ family protein [Agrococcus beijingensis]|uniref:VanZ family protein n=1 Tax=Agrococcus beijingensis TaxID=3068634 RepID=UPI002741F2F0|nr:VanZ family protein [Agrococcus sp. REN33]
MGWLAGRRVWRWLFGAAVLAQLVALYLPDPPSSGGLPGADKVVHFGIFLAPALLGVLAGLRPVLLGALLVAHAIVSELLQHFLLPGRGGDPWDALADVVGVAVGLAIAAALRRRATAARGRPADPR